MIRKKTLVVALGVLAASAMVRAAEPDGALWCRSAALPAEARPNDFLRETDAAMNRMMAGMEVEPSGDVDRDFAARMIPHHQGAIEMARAELRYGKNEALRRIAQEIVVDQQQEIAVMRLALETPR